MRTLAWVLVVLGLMTIAGALALYAIDYAGSYYGHDPQMSWPVVGVGSAIAAFGVLLLAIRPPAVKADDGKDGFVSDEPYR